MPTIGVSTYWRIFTKSVSFVRQQSLEEVIFFFFLLQLLSLVGPCSTPPDSHPPLAFPLPRLGQRTSCIPMPSRPSSSAGIGPLLVPEQRTDGAAHLSAQVTKGLPPLAFPEFSRPGQRDPPELRKGWRVERRWLTCLGTEPRLHGTQTDNKRPPSFIFENARMPKPLLCFPPLFSNSQDFSGAFWLRRAASAAGPYPRLSPPPVECKDGL